MLGLNAKSTSNKRQDLDEGTVGTASSELLHQKENLLVPPQKKKTHKKLNLETEQREVREMRKHTLKNARNEG